MSLVIMSALDRKRFNAKTKPDPSTTCRLWNAAKNSRGYGIACTEGGVRHLAHRLALYQIDQNVPPKAEAAHKCGNKACVNVAHLRWATSRENAGDKYEHGTMQRKLSDRDVWMIRCMVLSLGATDTELARVYSIHVTSIRDIRTGKNWRRLPFPTMDQAVKALKGAST